jgi:hypothetical protein
VADEKFGARVQPLAASNAGEGPVPGPLANRGAKVEGPSDDEGARPTMTEPADLRVRARSIDAWLAEARTSP